MHALFTERLVESWYSLQIQVANNVLYCKTGLEMKRILSYQECISLRNPKKLITSVESSNVNEVFIFIACRISKSQLVHIQETTILYRFLPFITNICHQATM